MDQDVTTLARQLEAKLKQVDPRTERETLAWAHGFLVALIERIEKSVPGLTLKRISASDSNLDETQRILEELTSKLGLSDDLDSLEQRNKLKKNWAIWALTTQPASPRSKSLGRRD